MAFEEYDDYEQEQLVKEWLGKNWFTIAAGIALGIGGLWGYGQWQNAQTENSLQAAGEFAQLEQQLAVADLSTGDEQLSAYEVQHGSNIYVIQARLSMAQKAIEQNELSIAKQQYQAVLASKPSQPIAELVRLRLARLLVSEQDYVGASKELSLVTSQAYQTMVEEVTGDMLAAQGEPAKAHDAYQLALNAGEGYSGKQIVEMKMADIKVSN